MGQMNKLLLLEGLGGEIFLKNMGQQNKGALILK